MTRAMILCAGLSTRLGPLAQALPKPLLPVADVAIVRYGVALLVGHGIRDIVVNLHYLGELFERELGDGAALGARIQYSREPVILGTGGGLKAALPLLDPGGHDEPFVSMNGKLIVDADLGGLLAAHVAHGDALGTLLVRRVPDAVAWGAVEVDGGGRVRNVLGDGAHMFCGVHVTRPSVVARLPDGEACMIRQGYLPWLLGGERVMAFEHEGYFAEHSTPERYLEGNAAVVGGARLRFPAGPAAGVDAGARVDGAHIVGAVRVASGAVVEPGATVGPNAVIGRGAVVRAGRTVRDAVVWPGVVVEEDLDHAIATPDGIVRV